MQQGKVHRRQYKLGEGCTKSGSLSVWVHRCVWVLGKRSVWNSSSLSSASKTHRSNRSRLRKLLTSHSIKKYWFSLRYCGHCINIPVAPTIGIWPVMWPEGLTLKCKQQNSSQDGERIDLLRTLLFLLNICQPCNLRDIGETFNTSWQLTFSVLRNKPTNSISSVIWIEARERRRCGAKREEVMLVSGSCEFDVHKGICQRRGGAGMLTSWGRGGSCVHGDDNNRRQHGDRHRLLRF